MAKHRLGRVVTVGAYQRKGKQRDVLDIITRLVRERNGLRTDGYAEPMPTRNTVTRHHAGR